MAGYGVFAAYYDRLTQNVGYAERAAYFHALIQENMSAPNVLLDLACGTGTLSFAFAHLGYDVIGVDNSQEMLSAAMQKKAEESDLPFTNPLFICQDMTALELYDNVDVALCALDSLNHITDLEALSAVFAGVGEYVRQGGLFLFDVNTPYKHKKVLADHTFVYEAEEVFCVWQNQPMGEDRVEITLDFFIPQPDGRYTRQSEQFTERAYAHKLLVGLLEQNGFDLVGCYGDDTKEPVTDTTERAIYIAKKR